MKLKKRIRIFLWSLLILFILMNGIAFMHAYKFTHFTNASVERTPKKLSFGQKIKTLFTGVNNPRPVNKEIPPRQFQTIKIKSNVELDCWFMKTDTQKGTVIIFHGYGGEKSSMLDKANVFLQLGYNTMLVDFMGSGKSEGNNTTIGYKEAEEVKDCFEYLAKNGFENIHLFGTSMGAVAIMKAIKDYSIQPQSIILECPFGTMYKTVCARFKALGVPTFPMAGLLVFWGGVQNNFQGFSHNPEEYAESIHCPTLLLYGEKDERVSRREINNIYKNLKGKKRLALYPLSGHENYLLKYKDNWISDIMNFIQ